MQGSILPPLRWLAVDLLPVGHIRLKDGVAGFARLCARDGGREMVSSASSRSRIETHEDCRWVLG
jgi:hypothetical protein